MTPGISNALLLTQSDARLVSLAAEGHERAFEAIVERYRRPLLRYCRRMLPETRAEDAVQQAFLNAWAALERGADVHDLRPWLYRIAHNTAINGLKANGFDYDELGEESHRTAGGPHDELVQRDEVRETLTNLASLPDRQREALLRTAVSGDPQSDVANDLGITDGAVRQLVHRARAQLRAVATAFTPAPLVAWVASLAPAGGAEPAQRIAEVAVGAGGAGAVGAVGVALKASAVVVATGAIVAPGSPVRKMVETQNPAASAASAASRSRAPAGDSASRQGPAGGSASPQDPAGGSASPQDPAGGSASPRDPAPDSASPQGAAGGSASPQGPAGDAAYGAPAISAGDGAYGR